MIGVKRAYKPVSRQDGLRFPVGPALAPQLDRREASDGSSVCRW